MKSQIHLISKKGTEKILTSINNNLDNINATCSHSISEFISKSIQNKYFPKRILLTSNSVDYVEALDELYYHLRENSENTEVVLVCSMKNEVLDNSEIVCAYKEIFQESIYHLAYNDSNWTIKQLISVITDSLSELEERSNIFEQNHNLASVFEKIIETHDKTVSASSWVEIGNLGDKDVENPTIEGALDDEEEYTLQPVEEPENLTEWSSSKGVDEEYFQENTWENGIDELGVEGKFSEPNIFSLGGLGGQHVETGFLGSGVEEEVIEPVDEERVEEVDGGSKQEELLSELQDSDELVEEVYNITPSEYPAPIDSETPVLYSANVPNSFPKHGLDFNSADGVVELVTGTRDIDTSNYIIQKALELQDQGVLVLIVDFDFKYNNILSNIDITRFTNSQRAGVGVYEEDGLYFLSAGYNTGEVHSIEKLLPLVRTLVGKGTYGKIFIDAPIDGLGKNSLKGLHNFQVNLLVRGDYASFVRTYVAAEGVSNELMLNYFYNGRVTILGGNVDWREDLNEFRKPLVPGKVDWLNDAYLGQQ